MLHARLHTVVIENGQDFIHQVVSHIDALLIQYSKKVFSIQCDIITLVKQAENVLEH